MNVIKEVSRLLDIHGETFLECPGCEVCQKIEALREELDRPPEEKFKHILEKGQDMTKSDIEFLLDNGVSKRLIQEAMNMNKSAFYKLLEQLGIQGGSEMVRLKITVDEYLELSKTKKDYEIAKMKHVSPATLCNWKRKHRDELEKKQEEQKKEGVQQVDTKHALSPDTTLHTRSTKKVGKYEKIGTEIGRLVDKKNKAYGDAFNKSGEFLKILYPEGIRPEQYNDMLAIVRIFDKMMRIANRKEAFGENPWNDITGYGILKAEIPKEGADR